MQSLAKPLVRAFLWQFYDAQTVERLSDAPFAGLDLVQFVGPQRDEVFDFLASFEPLPAAPEGEATEEPAAEESDAEATDEAPAEETEEAAEEPAEDATEAAPEDAGATEEPAEQPTEEATEDAD